MLLQNQGRDSTLEPAYFAIPLRNRSGSSDIDKETIEKLERSITELQKSVYGTSAEGYKDGLEEKVRELKILVDSIIETQGAAIYYDTTANWNSQPNLIPERGSIYIYSDAKQIDGVDVPRLKIGNGYIKLQTLSFIDQDIVDTLANLVQVTQEEKNFWNNKVTCYLNEQNEENLVFSKD